MADIKRILDAMSALARAANVRGLQVSVLPSGDLMFTIQADSDEQLRALAKQLDATDIEDKERDGHRWLSAYCLKPYIAIHGPHHKVEEVAPIDPVKVESAIAQAEKAVQS